MFSKRPTISVGSPIGPFIYKYLLHKTVIETQKQKRTKWNYNNFNLLYSHLTKSYQMFTKLSIQQTQNTITSLLIWIPIIYIYFLSLSWQQSYKPTPLICSKSNTTPLTWLQPNKPRTHLTCLTYKLPLSSNGRCVSRRSRGGAERECRFNVILIFGRLSSFLNF